MKIGNVEAVKGKVSKGHLNAGELSNGSKVDMPVIIIKGEQEGPTLWINSTIHGDELNGIYACKKLSEEINPKKLKGTVIMTPLSNPMAYQGRDKFTSIDKLDMDQHFPGSPNGWFSQRGAFVLFEEIKKHANYLISMHTLGPVYDAIPYTVFKKAADTPEEIFKQTKKIALAMGCKANCLVDLSNIAAEIPGNITGNLDVNCLLNGIPAFMVELGSGGCFEPDMIEFGVKGCYNVLNVLEMYDKPVQINNKDRVIVTKRKFPTTNRAGLFEPFVKAGEVYKKGSNFGRVFNALEDLESFETEEDWFVLGVRNNPAVDSGEIMGAIALDWEPIDY